MKDSELFAVDIDLVIQLLSSFEGTQIYPEQKQKKEVFEIAQKEYQEKFDLNNVPDGYYTLEVKLRDFEQIVKGQAEVKSNKIIVKKGSICAPSSHPPSISLRNNLDKFVVVNHVLINDVICTSPTSAAHILTGRTTSGWNVWRNGNGEKMDIYRNPEKYKTKKLTSEEKLDLIPEDIYYINRFVKDFGSVNAEIHYYNKQFKIKKGSLLAPAKTRYVENLRKSTQNFEIKRNILQNDIICQAASRASSLVIGNNSNGFDDIKDIKGHSLNEILKGV